MVQSLHTSRLSVVIPDFISPLSPLPVPSTVPSQQSLYSIIFFSTPSALYCNYLSTSPTPAQPSSIISYQLSHTTSPSAGEKPTAPCYAEWDMMYAHCSCSEHDHLFLQFLKDLILMSISQRTNYATTWYRSTTVTESL